MSRANGTNPRAMGTNSRALGTNKRGQRRVLAKAERMGWNPPEVAGDRLPRWLRFEILKRDGFACCYCGYGRKQGVLLQVDHVTPKAAGGTDAPTNLATSCFDCNAGKAARKLSERLL